VGELPTLRLIPSQFRQLFQNLIINALKFCKEDYPPEIEIFADKTPGFNIGGVIDDQYGLECWNIYVKDNGIGFEQKYADEIFTLFKRLNSYDKFEGTGIGLSICKKIVDKHTGYISAISNAGDGTTFIISMPVMGAKEIESPSWTEIKML
jgi:signal transduction histidine kinase